MDDVTERVVPPADPARDENHEAAADERPGAAMSPDGETATDRIATPAAHAAPGLGVFPAVPVGVLAEPRNRRRAGVLAAVAAGLLALGGVGGYAIGRRGRRPAAPRSRGGHGRVRPPPRTVGCRRRLPGRRCGDGSVGRRLGRNRSRRHRLVGHGYREYRNVDMTTTLAVPSAPPVPTIDSRAARADAAVRAVGAAAVAGGLLLVTYWWIAGGGLSDLTSWANALMSLGRSTGLIASDLLLVQVLLMARIPVVERAVGQDRLARLAPLDRVHLVHPDARPHRADHLGVRRGRSRARCPRRSGTSRPPTPACCSRWPGRCAW